METKTHALKEYASQLKLGGIQDQAEELIRKASEEKCSYLDFSLSLLEAEINRRLASGFGISVECSSSLIGGF